MNDFLSGRAALVTGGSRGIGAAVALRLAGAGADVALTYRDDADAAKAVAGRITDAGGRAAVLQLDVADPTAVDAAVHRGSAATSVRAASPPTWSTPVRPTPP